MVNPNVSPSLANSGTNGNSVFQFSIPRAPVVSLGTVTLAASGASSTTIFDERIGYNSYIGLEPKTQTAASTYFPYGAFQDTTDQSIATITATANISLNVTDYALGTSLVDGYKIRVDYSGLYNVQFSIQLANADSQIQDIDIWLRKNGSDVAGSNSKFSVDSKHGSINGHVIAALNFNIELAKDDYVSLAWATNGGGEYFAIGVGGTVTGKGADLLIIDDPHSEQEAALAQGDPTVFDKIYEWYTSGPRQRLQPGKYIFSVV